MAHAYSLMFSLHYALLRPRGKLIVATCSKSIFTLMDFVDSAHCFHTA